MERTRHERVNLRLNYHYNMEYDKLVSTNDLEMCPKRSIQETRRNQIHAKTTWNKLV